jgi:RNA polymerase sigma-32 factor
MTHGFSMTRMAPRLLRSNSGIHAEGAAAMRSDLDRYMKEVSRYPVLSVEDERDLARAYRDRGDTRAGHALVAANLRFVVKVALGYQGHASRLADLVQEGNMGLMRAVQKFDPDMGIRLITYAVWWIRAYIQNHVLHSWSVVKIGTTQAQRKLFFGLAQARREDERTGGEGDPDERVARRLRVDPEEVRSMGRRLEGRDLSLDAPIGDGTATHVDHVATDETPTDERLGSAQEAQLLEAGVVGALAQLDERERVIVERRIMAERPATLQDLGAELGVSRERTRQLEARALGKLRLALQSLADGLEMDEASPSRASSAGSEACPG